MSVAALPREGRPKLDAQQVDQPLQLQRLRP